MAWVATQAHWEPSRGFPGDSYTTGGADGSGATWVNMDSLHVEFSSVGIPLPPGALVAQAVTFIGGCPDAIGSAVDCAEYALANDAWHAESALCIQNPVKSGDCGTFDKVVAFDDRMGLFFSLIGGLQAVGLPYPCPGGPPCFWMAYDYFGTNAGNWPPDFAEPGINSQAAEDCSVSPCVVGDLFTIDLEESVDFDADYPLTYSVEFYNGANASGGDATVQVFVPSTFFGGCQGPPDSSCFWMKVTVLDSRGAWTVAYW